VCVWQGYKKRGGGDAVWHEMREWKKGRRYGPLSLFKEVVAFSLSLLQKVCEKAGRRGGRREGGLAMEGMQTGRKERDR